MAQVVEHLGPEFKPQNPAPPEILSATAQYQFSIQYLCYQFNSGP
jgi:hypothetical protein